jgi:hypothetical protein
MRISILHRSALAILIAAVQSGCGGSQFTNGPYPAQIRSLVTPGAKNLDLIYVSDTNAKTVSVYSWYGKLLGMLTGFTEPAGLCSDAGGNVFVDDLGASDVVEYAHNGSIPIKTLKDPGQFPIGCAVDPVTGNLAVTNYGTVSHGPGSISIYTKAKGRPKIYSDLSVASMDFCGYDNRGNLFADGFDVGSAVTLVELHKGGTTLSTIKVNAHIAFPGAVQWDGKYLTVADTATDAIYRLQVSGSRAKVQGRTGLNGVTGLAQSWIAGNKVVAANVESSGPTGDVVFWNYPAGGTPTKTFGMLHDPFGVTVSVPPPK